MYLVDLWMSKQSMLRFAGTAQHSAGQELAAFIIHLLYNSCYAFAICHRSLLDAPAAHVHGAETDLWQQQ